MITVLLACTLGLVTAGSAVGGQDRPLSRFAPWPWDWSKMNTFSYGANSTGWDNETTLAHKIRHQIVFTDNILDLCSSLGLNTWQCHERRAATAGMVKEYAREVHSPTPYAVFVYRGIVVGPPEIWNDSRYSGFWLTDDLGTYHPGKWDFRNSSAREYFRDSFVGVNTAQDSRLDGVFIDTGDAVASSADLTLEHRAEVFNATVEAWRITTEMLNRGNKYFAVSLKSHFSNLTSATGFPQCKGNESITDTCSPYGEEVIFELMGDTIWFPFREYNQPGPDFGPTAGGCEAAIWDLRYESQTATTFACNNNAHPENATNGQYNMSLAAYLLGMEEGSYFGAGTHWYHWFSEFDKPLGTPCGPPKQDGHRLERKFEGLTVRADCESWTTSFDWHDLYPCSGEEEEEWSE